MRCEDLVKKITTNGGAVLEEMVEKSGSVSAHKIILYLNKMYIKLSFLNVLNNQIEANKFYKYGIDEDWKELNEEIIFNL